MMVTAEMRGVSTAIFLLLSTGGYTQSESLGETEIVSDMQQTLPKSPVMTEREIERIGRPAKKSLSVEARLTSSARVDWNRIESSDPAYQLLLEKLAIGKVGELEKIHLLPYGVRINVQANDPTKRLALHVDQVVRKGDPPQLLPSSALTAFVNGERYHSMQQDLELLGESIWAVHGAEQLEYQMLFLLKTKEGDRSGEYQVGFRLLSSELP